MKVALYRLTLRYLNASFFFPLALGTYLFSLRSNYLLVE